jgi:general secretion pathway protein D
MIILKTKCAIRHSWKRNIKTITLAKTLVLAVCALMALNTFCPSLFVREAFSAASIFVNPSSQTVSGVGETFSVNITILNVIDLYAYEINLYYDPAIVNGTTIVEGPFLKTHVLTWAIPNFNDNYNSTHGLARMAVSVLGDVAGVTGTGVLCTISFLSKQVGSSILTLAGTKLQNSHYAPIAHTTSGGQFQVVPVERDVAVISVNASTSEAVAGEIVDVYAVVLNQGGKTETFDVTAYANDTAVGTKTVTGLAKSSNTTVDIPWNTGGATVGEYVIKAEVQSLPGETDLSDNVFVDGTVTIVPGLHDVSVESVAVSASELYEGQVAEIQVMVSNNGNFTETFDVSTYFGVRVIQTKTVNSLASKGIQALSFLWNTTGFPLESSLPVIANASTVQGETDVYNNVFVDGTVTILPRIVPTIAILEVTPSNQIGEPASSFRIGTMAYFKVTINATSVGPEPVLVTLNVFDADQRVLGVVSFQGPLVPGISSFVLGFPIPALASIGVSSVHANVFTDWPHLGGTAYCPERYSTFQISGG